VVPACGPHGAASHRAHLFRRVEAPARSTARAYFGRTKNSRICAHRGPKDGDNGKPGPTCAVPPILLRAVAYVGGPLDHFTSESLCAHLPTFFLGGGGHSKSEQPLAPAGRAPADGPVPAGSWRPPTTRAVAGVTPGQVRWRMTVTARGRPSAPARPGPACRSGGGRRRRHGRGVSARRPPPGGRWRRRSAR
jgi:hypothetical protein